MPLSDCRAGVLAPSRFAHGGLLLTPVGKADLCDARGACVPFWRAHGGGAVCASAFPVWSVSLAHGGCTGIVIGCSAELPIAVVPLGCDTFHGGFSSKRDICLGSSSNRDFSRGLSSSKQDFRFGTDREVLESSSEVVIRAACAFLRFMIFLSSMSPVAFSQGGVSATSDLAVSTPPSDDVCSDVVSERVEAQF